VSSHIRPARQVEQQYDLARPALWALEPALKLRHWKSPAPRRSWSMEHWSEADRIAFGNLPDAITLYWGGDAAKLWNYSWTTDVSIAEGFARGHRRNHHPNPQIVCATVPKKNVCMFLTDREESEAVLFRRPSGPALYKNLEQRWDESGPPLPGLRRDGPDHTAS
jgi:hypothetical protein